MPKEDYAKRLADSLRETIANIIEIEAGKKIAIPFSGGLDSTIIAKLAGNFSKNITLYAVGMEGSNDLFAARTASKELGMELREVVISEEMIERTIPPLVRAMGRVDLDPRISSEWGMGTEKRMASPVQLGFNMVLYFACEAAKRDGVEVFMTGQGADELFYGYKRYEAMEEELLVKNAKNDLERVRGVVAPREIAMADEFNIALRYPYLSKSVLTMADLISPKLKMKKDGSPFETGRKWILRSAAQKIGLGLSFCNTPKKAAQYGSGIAGALKRMAKKKNLRQNEFLELFLK